jgi:hypothetical protein
MQTIFTDAKKGTSYNDLYQNGRILSVPFDEMIAKHMHEDTKTSFVSEDQLHDINQQCKVYKISSVQIDT